MNPVIQLKQINSDVKLQLSINLIELYSEQKSIQILHELLFFIVLYNSENTKKNNQNLPGMGGIFNHINSNLYHYAGNNPVKYVDPDGETISYTYDKGGQVTGVTGERNGDEIVYVSKIGYDEYGQRSFIEYGNGVKTAYTYDENRRWLDSIETLSATQKLLQNMSYSFDRVGNVSGYTNDSGNYSTTQKYSYDSLYQLVGAKGKTEYKPNWPYDYEDHHGYVSNYEQSWRFDNIGNMKSKYSEMIDKPHNQHSSSDLNYSFEYTYDPNYAHRTISADNMFYTYDANGNIINERIDRQATKEELQHDIELAEGVYSLDYGIALPNQPDVETKPYSRSYIWNEKNQLKTSVENGFVVNYRYGEDGQRAVKSSAQGETLYFNNMWQMSTTPMGMRQTKHIFVGETRIATKNNWWKDSGTEYERYNTYYFHSDHLGSAQLITDWRGEEYERIEYTPYGELWIEKVRDGFETINYRFTGKEMDSETGLYYYGARYLDPKYSRWLSTDPALGDYVPQSSKGEGGIYNYVNMNLYHYANNNPISYKDPDGEFVINAAAATIGALSGAIISGVTTKVAGGSTRDVVAAALGGAASGALAGVTLGGSLLAQATGSAALGAASAVVGDVVTNAVSGNEITASGVAKAALGGAVGGLAGFGLGRLKVSADINNTEIVMPSKSHTNSTPGHWDKMLSEADDMAFSGKYNKVYLNKGIRNEIPNASTNRRPDIMGVRKNGKIDQIEVMSKTDSYSTLQNRMIDNRSMMGARGGNINVVEP